MIILFSDWQAGANSADQHHTDQGLHCLQFHLQVLDGNTSLFKDCNHNFEVISGDEKH